MDPGVGRPPAPASAGAALRRQHLLSRTRFARLLRTADCPCVDGRPVAVAGGVARPRLQPRPAPGLRADGLGRLRAGVRVDGRQGRRDARRIDVRVQHAYPDRLAHIQGIHAWGLAADAPLRRSNPRPRALARCRVAGGLDDGHGLHLRLPRRVRRDHDRGRAGGARAGLVAARGSHRDASCRRHDPRGRGHPAGLPSLPSRREAGPGPLDRIGQPVLGDADRDILPPPAEFISRHGAGDSGPTPSTDSFQDSSSSSWPSRQSTGGAVRARANAGLGEAMARRSAPVAPANRHARRDRGDGPRPVARHAHAGVRLVVRRVSAHAGPAGRGQIRQPVPARHGGARRVWPRRLAQPTSHSLGGRRRGRTRDGREHRVAARAALLQALRRHSRRLLAAR